VGFDSLTKAEAVEKAFSLIEERRAAYVVTPNPEIVMLCNKNAEMMQAVRKADLVIPDGIGVIYGAKILSRPLKERIPGIELATEIISRLPEKNMSLFLFGAKPGVADKAAEELKKTYPGLNVCGTENGYFSDDAPIIEKINSAAPDLLLVCLGAPKQEKWMLANTGKLNVGLMMGLGGSLDVFAGVVQRSPESWNRLGLEWLYRLIKQPSRIKRMIKLPLFLFAAMGERIRGTKQ
jgi:N-acetylglucosaminyldiphosphoundecaprenol N-acetyl-beta-D-mannosaminyltransferase